MVMLIAGNLQSCFERDPLLPGYTFVPKGNVYITRHCRSKAKESQQMLYVVYVSTSGFLSTYFYGVTPNHFRIMRANEISVSASPRIFMRKF